MSCEINFFRTRCAARQRLFPISRKPKIDSHRLTKDADKCSASHNRPTTWSLQDNLMSRKVKSTELLKSNLYPPNRGTFRGSLLKSTFFKSRSKVIHAAKNGVFRGEGVTA